MRERHHPRLRRASPAGDAARPGGRDQLPAPAIIGEARAVGQARRDADRWANEGGSLAREGPRAGLRIAAVQ
jgi:hypothetical protein